MFTGPPLPLPPEFPLKELTRLAGSLSQMGAWVRSDRRDFQFIAHTGARRCRILISRDLGSLLGRCSHVAIRQESSARVFETKVLIRWRALQVVTGMPCLPNPELLQEIFPGAVREPAGFRVPVLTRAPEEVLADCITHGIAVAGSRIVYNLGSPSRQRSGPDS